MFALQVNGDDYVECLVSKQLLFHSLPQILILHIKRFHLGQQVTKNNRHIDFPLDLDLAPFCTKKCQVSKHSVVCMCVRCAVSCQISLHLF